MQFLMMGKTMIRRKKARYENRTYAEVEKFYRASFQGTRYFKQLRHNSYVKFYYGRYATVKGWPFAYHREIEIHYMQKGNTSYYINGKIHHLSKREIMIVMPNEVHGGMAVRPGKAMEKATLVFPLAWVGVNSKRMRLPRKIALTEEEAARLDLLCGQMAAEARTQDSLRDKMIRIKFHEFFCLVQRIALRPALKITSNPIAGQLKNYIDRNFVRQIKISELSKKFGYSGEHLTRQFKVATGSTLKHYILQRRAIEARLLIQRYPNLKLSAIAEQTGFSDYSLFSRAFKYFFGVIPAACRQLDQKPMA